MTKWQGLTNIPGKRFDAAAALALPSLSRAYIQKLIEQGSITVNGELSKAGYKLREGDTLQIDSALLDLEQEVVDLPILYEDDDVLVINKPAGIISHARGRYWYEASVASFVRSKMNEQGASERSGIVHRLDRATSGVMITAKHPEALSMLQKQFSERQTVKTYMAVIQGQLEPAKAIIDMPIERNPKKPQTFRVGSNGKPSVTAYETTAYSEKYSLIKLTPKTGRTHQLRVHLKQLGHPIVGDELYEGEPADRLYLHALSLEITLPSGEKRTFSSPLPDSFQEFVA